MDCPWNEANENSPCSGRMTPDGLCMAHSILFDFWGCCGGYDQYNSLPLLEARASVDKWHRSLSQSEIERIQK